MRMPLALQLPAVMNQAQTVNASQQVPERLRATSTPNCTPINANTTLHHATREQTYSKSLTKLNYISPFFIDSIHRIHKWRMGGKKRALGIKTRRFRINKK